MNKEDGDIKYFTNLIEDNKTHKYDYRKYYTPIFDKRLENILNLISKLQKELDRKDKVIKLMAEVIEECRQNGVIEFNENIDLSEIAGENRIIEYFYKKAEEENE